MTLSSQATGQPLDPKKDIKKYFQVGVPDPEKGVPGTKVFFDTLDVTKLRVSRTTLPSSRLANVGLNRISDFRLVNDYLPPGCSCAHKVIIDRTQTAWLQTAL